MRNSSLGTAVVLFLSVAIFLKEGHCQGDNGNWGIPNGNMQNWASQFGGQNWANQNGGQMWPNQNDWQNWKSQYGGKKWAKKKDGKKMNNNNNGQNWAANWQKWAGMTNGAMGATNSEWLKMAEQYMAQWNNNNGAVPNNGMEGKKNKKDMKNNGNVEY